MNSSAIATDSSNGETTPISPSALVPQLSEYNITEQDLATAIRVLDAVSNLDPKKKKKKRKANTSNNNTEEESDGLSAYKQPNLRQFRKSLSSTLSLHQQTMYEGKSEMQYYEDRIAERTLKRQKMAERAQQKKYVATTDLRKGRVEKLEKLKEDSKEEEEMKLKQLEYLIPDGHVDTTNSNGNNLLLENDSVTTAKSEEKEVQLPKLRSCYVCKVRFRTLHHFYDQLCTDCAPFNYSKRHQTANLSNKVAVVTGSRVKIGYQVCLKLLRSGCTVVATTRFPNNAVSSYRKEEDFDSWKDRLHVYGLDLRDVTGLEAFTRYLKLTFGRNGIDILINNACQTVRRPGGYYLPLVEKESEIWNNGDESHKQVLSGCLEFERIRRRLVEEHTSDKGQVGGNLLPTSSTVQQKNLLSGGPETPHSEATQNGKEEESAVVAASKEATTMNPFESTGISHSAAMSQMAIIPEDVGVDEKVMPQGLSDINGHQIDLRSHNSWLLKLDQVSTPEVMECMYINAIAPFVLNSRLKPLMEAQNNDRPDRYIINVSAMEGKFYRYKMPNHPHTNMAKAALNMLTRTSSEDLATKSRIYMNSVDTGWINDENPLEKASKIAKTNLFQTPIDEVDAAARILDPVFVGINMDESSMMDEEMKKGEKKKGKDYGKFFKDYKETEW